MGPIQHPLDGNHEAQAGSVVNRLPAPRPIGSLDRVREAVAVRVEATSLQIVAREAGVSRSVLEQFLSGGTPQRGSRLKLEAWWDRAGLKPRADLSGAGARAALEALVRDMEPVEREGAIRALIGDLVTMYGECGPLPPWLEEIQDREQLPPDTGHAWLPRRGVDPDRSRSS
jgi:hypothetical protein